MPVSAAGDNRGGLKFGGWSPGKCCVVLYHAVRAVLPAEAGDAVFHHLQPADRQPAGITFIKPWQDLLLQDLIQAEGVALVLNFRIRAVGVSPMAKPLLPFQASAHQPSSVDQLRAPLSAAFWPLVPEASCGRLGVFSQTSTPCTSRRARSME